MLPGTEEKTQTSEQVGKKVPWDQLSFPSSLDLVSLFIHRSSISPTKLMLISVVPKQVMKSGCCRFRLLERVLRVSLLSEVAKNNSS